jgi:hypothetical protein
MSMKFFTLCSLCVLVFCMLLALSGTTDLPGESEFGSSLTLVSPIPPPGDEAADPIHPPIYRIQDWSETRSSGTSGMEAIHEIIRNREVRILGVLFIAGWIFLSFKLLSTD